MMRMIARDETGSSVSSSARTSRTFSPGRVSSSQRKTRRPSQLRDQAGGPAERSFASPEDGHLVRIPQVGGRLLRVAAVGRDDPGVLPAEAEPGEGDLDRADPGDHLAVLPAEAPDHRLREARDPRIARGEQDHLAARRRGGRPSCRGCRRHPCPNRSAPRTISGKSSFRRRETMRTSAFCAAARAAGVM